MGISRITFYRMPEMTKDKNFIIEDFETYLNSLTHTSGIKVQYIKPEFETTIKMNSQTAGALIQDKLLFPQSTMYDLAYYNYLKVEYGIIDDDSEEPTDQPDVYYFVNSWNWKASNTVEISITMDVLNMIGVPSATNKYCNWDEKTKIFREHQKRYGLKNGRYYWIIDRKHEGLSTELIKDSEFTIFEEKNHRLWYYAYMNALIDPSDPSNYVEMYLIPEDDITLHFGGYDYTIYGIHNAIWDAARINPKTIKIVEWPYKPSHILEYDEDQDDYTIDGSYSADFNVNNHMLKIVNYDHSFGMPNNNIILPLYIANSDLTQYAPISEFTSHQYNGTYSVSNYLSANVTDNLRSKNWEVKLWHSDFHYSKYIYDTNSKQIKYEEFDLAEDNNFQVLFMPSGNVSSKMLFIFRSKQWKKGVQDFFNVMGSSRNNEMTLYNSAYYNYKLAQQGWDEFKQKMNLAFGAGKTLGSALNIAEGGIGSAVSNLIGLGQQWANADIAMWETAELLKQQAIAVSGSDDLDLFRIYSMNKLIRCEYKVPDTYEDLLFDIFHYTGYIQNKMGIPATSGRHWFNFVQCEPVFKNMLLNLTPGMWDEYKRK